MQQGRQLFYWPNRKGRGKGGVGHDEPKIQKRQIGGITKNQGPGGRVPGVVLALLRKTPPRKIRRNPALHPGGVIGYLNNFNYKHRKTQVDP